MARDRLAAMRQQRGGEQDTSANSYPTQAAYGGGSNPYAQQDNRGYEMHDVQASSTNLVGGGYAGGGGAGDMSSFYAEISELQDAIKGFNDNVARISDLHSRSLNNMDEAATQRNNTQLDALVNETSSLSMDLKKRIKTLERTGAPGRDGQIRRQQTALVKSKFVEAIQNYQQVEQQYRQKYKQRMERQFKIVRPDATPEEVQAAVDDVQGGQVFQQALMNSNRYGESRAAYREVQERHEEIKRIEETMVELAQLFNDMSILVEQQDEQINVIETTAGEVEKDMEVGVGYTEKAVDSARAARKKRWICFAITIVLLIIIAIVVAVVVVQHLPKKSDGGDSKTVTATATPSPSASASAAAQLAAVIVTSPLPTPTAALAAIARLALPTAVPS